MIYPLTVVCVYKTGGDFDVEYVQYLYNHFEHYDFVCLTDANDVPDNIPTLPLKHDWPKWWSKMELFEPNRIVGDILYLDLDTVFVDEDDDFEWLFKACDHNIMIMLSDFYFPKNLASGVMYIPCEMKEVFWNEFIKCPEHHMYENRGDQDFLMNVIHDYELEIDRWDEIVPDSIASYKVHYIKKYPAHIRPLQVDTTHTKIVCYHGKPRPKDTNWAKHKV